MARNWTKELKEYLQDNGDPNGQGIETERFVFWLRNGKPHRIDGPAIYESGDVLWFINGRMVAKPNQIEGCETINTAPWFKSNQDKLIWLDKVTDSD